MNRRPRSTPFRAAMTVLGIPLVALCLGSCGSYSDVGNTMPPTQGDLKEGDRIRVHLDGGQIVEDTFVRLTDAELICATRIVGLDSVERIEKWSSTTSIWIFMGGVLVTSFFLALNQGMSSAKWF
jgi:hypothetical protein